MEYRFNLEDVIEKKNEEELNNDPVMQVLMYIVQNLNDLDLTDYDINIDQYNKFELAQHLLKQAVQKDEKDYSMETNIDEAIKSATISLRFYSAEIKDIDAFKHAIRLADSLEIEGCLDMTVEMNLTFFNMMVRVRDGSKN